MSTQLQNKLLQYAPEPPEKVWDAIANVLGENATPAFVERLYKFEEAPSPKVWGKIHNQLDVPQPVVPFIQRYKKLATYSAAAAILIFLAVSTALLISKKTGPAIIANTPSTAQNQKSKTNSNISSSQHTTQASSLLATANGDETTNQGNGVRDKKNLLNRLHPQTKLGSVMIAKTFLPRRAETRQTVSTDAPIEKYMVYSDGDGNAMKLPKKLFDFITCVKEDITCKQEMQQLQQRFASSVLTTDFTGVIEILKTLKENQ
jgi:hypothetical protein